MTVRFEGNPSTPIFNINAEGLDGKQYDNDGIDGSQLATLKRVYSAECGHFTDGKYTHIVNLIVVGNTNIKHGNDCPKCNNYRKCRGRS